jgi:O-antigen/teichoic acid export membrane protein
VFAFAIIQPGRPQMRPAFTQARTHLPVVLGSGAVIGLLLGLSVVVVPRWGVFWFGVSLGIVIGIMMVCYVAVPSRLIGINPARSRRDKLVASAVGGAVGAVVCTPPYLLGRVGLVMLGWGRVFFVLGVIVFAVGLTLQAGATGAVKTVKMSAKLVGGRKAPDSQALSGDVPTPRGSSGSSP